MPSNESPRQPADFFGLKGRGRLRVGNNADIAMFDADTVGFGAARHDDG